MADDVLCLMTCVIKNPFPMMHQKSNKQVKVSRSRYVSDSMFVESMFTEENETSVHSSS